MKVASNVAVLLLSALICSQASAQNYILPEQVTVAYQAMIGKWEGSLTNEISGAIADDIPAVMEFKFILKNTSVYGTMRLTVSADRIIDAVQVYSWDAEKEVPTLFEVANVEGVYFYEGTLTGGEPGVFEFRTSKNTGKYTSEVTTKITFPDESTMIWSIDWDQDGTDYVNQKYVMKKVENKE